MLGPSMLSAVSLVQSWKVREDFWEIGGPAGSGTLASAMCHDSQALATSKGQTLATVPYKQTY
jgi:hypothetical protein